MQRIEATIRHATNGIILDTNVFLVFLVGLWNPSEISKYKRTATYTKDDYEFLVTIVERVGKLVTTPHILTEVCNLSDTLNKKHNYELYKILALLQTNARERRQEASRLMNEPLFHIFGIADTSLIDASKNNHLVITDEAACYAAIAEADGLVINLNHLRGEAWL